MRGVVILASMVRGVTLFGSLASHASRGMASGTWPKPGRGARWVILAIHTLTGYLLRFKRASRSTQGPRTCDSSKLHPIFSPSPRGPRSPRDALETDSFASRQREAHACYSEARFSGRYTLTRRPGSHYSIDALQRDQRRQLLPDGTPCLLRPKGSVLHQVFFR